MYSYSDIVRYKNIQNKLSERILLKDVFKLKDLRLVGGVDVAYKNRGNKISGIGCLVVMDFKKFEIVEKVIEEKEIKIPYIPGYLAFREIPVIMKAWRKLKHIPDVLLLDGQGVAHPRRMGLATHFGILVNHPTIGCAKNWLYGEYKFPDIQGKFTYLLDGNKKIGGVVRPLRGKRLLFVSPGNLISVDTSIKIVMRCLKGHRLPEPLMIAHNEVKKYSE